MQVELLQGEKKAGKLGSCSSVDVKRTTLKPAMLSDHK
jgi:hypothetical protein